jgi:hypothetical protein
MNKRLVSVAFMVSFFIFLSAMGGKGGGFERAPRVDKNFMVVVMDASGNKIEGEKFSWEGRLHFAGYMGLAQVTMPFERVKELMVGEKKDRKVKVTARLTDGSEAVFDIDSDARVYGESGFGSFMLTMDEIQSISFRGIK